MRLDYGESTSLGGVMVPEEDVAGQFLQFRVKSTRLDSLVQERNNFSFR